MKDLIYTVFKSHRFRLVWFLYISLIIFSLITRVILLIYSHGQVELTVTNALGIFAIGLFYDLANAAYFTIPVVIYLWLLPERIFQNKAHKFVLIGLFFLLNSILIFNAGAEFLFWDEFNTRFNFIAVDYLVYTTEVIGNIRQSYPIEWISVGIIVLSFLLTYLTRDLLSHKHQASVRFGRRTAMAALIVSAPLFGYFFIDARMHFFSNNSFVNELAGNGMYELFAAYRNNELDYEQFYPHLRNGEALNIIRKNFTDNFKMSNAATGSSIEHEVRSSRAELHLNVVLISIESFSAEFMHLFGNDQNITPFLDSIAPHSLVFTNLYATGTRTVRGLEALSLSVPPTPGQSIVRRPNNEHLFSLATVFNQKGYESKYIYGGYGYFDNMSYFFGHNGYTVIDRSSLSSNEIDYENIWGVADENLFTLSLREIDSTVKSGKHAFAHIMTTSNHRPFTYPEGRIDIPSHTGREGAVKYTDYAVAKFFREARKKDWFNNTIFIITADHCASSAGKTELPIKKYQVPMLIYSPSKITPGREGRLMSQIDIAPTVLGLLNFSYSSKFYGYDIFKAKKGVERAFISTYQALGFLKGDSMVVLTPRRKPEVMILGADKESLTRIKSTTKNSKVVDEAISWYQSASYAFKHGEMKQ